MISFNYYQLRRFSALYAALPLFVFCIGFLRPVFSAIGTAVLVISLYCVVKTDNTDPIRQGYISFSKKGLVLLFLVMLLWSYLGGMNGFFYQSSDWSIRNAVYRDLLTHRWPVIYEREQTALTYYIGHWLVPAAVSKPVYALFGAEAGWFFANQVLWLWSACGIFLAALTIMLYAGTDKLWKKIFCVVSFIGFSGMDIVGAWIKGKVSYVFDPQVLHLEWWPQNGYQFSANTVCLYWVFNQSIIPWLAVICFLMERDTRNYLFWGLCCLLCGPFPFVGLVILMCVKALVFLVRKVREKSVKTGLMAVFSYQNILLLLLVFPTVALFFLSNNAASAGVSLITAQEGSGLSVIMSEIGAYLKSFSLIFLLDAGIYLLLLFARQRRNPIFYTAAVSLFTLSFFKIGGGNDFGWRASLPSFFILMVFFVEEMIWDFENRNSLKRAAKIRWMLLLVVFALGLVTPALEVYRGIYHVVTQKTVQLADNSVYSLDNGVASSTFESSDYNHRLFFMYLAKTQRK